MTGLHLIHHRSVGNFLSQHLLFNLPRHEPIERNSSRLFKFAHIRKQTIEIATEVLIFYFCLFNRLSRFFSKSNFGWRVFCSFLITLWLDRADWSLTGGHECGMYDARP